MLNNLEAMGKPVRQGGNLFPPIRARDFTFSRAYRMRSGGPSYWLLAIGYRLELIADS